MTLWMAVLGCAAGCYALKLAGLSVPAHVLQHPTVSRVTDLLPVVLLSALIAIQAFTTGSEITIDARIAGVAAAVLLLLRRSFLEVVVAAALVTALIRYLW